MAQTKKVEMRESIKVSALELFRDKGYLKTTMTEIARSAGTAVANIYVYFPSKMHLFYEIYTPIIISRMLKIGSDAQNIEDTEKRLRFIFLSIWRDFPAEDNGFANNFIQAIATAPPDIEKPHDILKWCEDYLHNLIKECLPNERQHLLEDTMISFLAWMAFDGFVINLGKNEERDINKIVRHFTDMLMGK